MKDEPSDPAPPLPGVSAVWTASPVQISQAISAGTAALALFPKALAVFGIKTPADVALGVELVFGIATLVAPIVGMVWRAASRLQPLTWSKKAAAAAPAIPIQATPPVAIITDAKLADSKPGDPK
jgi:hypothetical protein